jgi:hypothetical protein
MPVSSCHPIRGLACQSRPAPGDDPDIAALHAELDG